MYWKEKETRIRMIQIAFLYPNNCYEVKIKHFFVNYFWRLYTKIVSFCKFPFLKCVPLSITVVVALSFINSAGADV